VANFLPRSVNSVNTVIVAAMKEPPRSLNINDAKLIAAINMSNGGKT